MITPIIMELEQDVVADKLAKLHEKKMNQVHFDLGDGLLSELITIAPADLQQYDLEGLEIDLHLLVDDPMEYVEECVALSPRRLIAQIERMGSQTLFLETVAGYGVPAGLGLGINTPIEEIEPEALKMCNTILLLAVPMGTSGSPFDKRVLQKIMELRKIFAGSILIDGGINPTTYTQVLAAGANEVGANSAYWKGEFNHG